MARSTTISLSQDPRKFTHWSDSSESVVLKLNHKIVPATRAHLSPNPKLVQVEIVRYCCVEGNPVPDQEPEGMAIGCVVMGEEPMGIVDLCMFFPMEVGEPNFD